MEKAKGYVLNPKEEGEEKITKITVTKMNEDGLTKEDEYTFYGGILTKGKGTLTLKDEDDTTLIIQHNI